MTISVISSVEYKPSSDGASPFTGNTSLVVTDPNLKYPKYLLKDGYKWFLELCEEYAVDHTQYCFVEIMQIDGVTWQLDDLS